MQVGLPDGSVVKNLPANAGDSGSIPRLGKSLVEEMATNSSILAWKIPWTEEPGRLSTWRNRVGHNWTTKQQQKRMQVSCQSLIIKSQDSIKIVYPIVAPQNRELPFKDLTSHTPRTAKILRYQWVQGILSRDHQEQKMSRFPWEV